MQTIAVTPLHVMALLYSLHFLVILMVFDYFFGRILQYLLCYFFLAMYLQMESITFSVISIWLNNKNSSLAMFLAL